MRKIVATTNSCRQCPRFSHGECQEVGIRVIDSSQVAPFCPLPDYPAQIIAGMETTIQTLRAPHVYAASIMLLNHIATKLKVPLHTNGMSIAIPLADGSDVVLNVDYIQDSSKLIPSAEIIFLHEGRTFRLYPDARTPELEEAVMSGTNRDQVLWRPHTIKQ